MSGGAPQRVVMQREIGVGDASHSSFFGQSRLAGPARRPIVVSPHIVVSPQNLVTIVPPMAGKPLNEDAVSNDLSDSAETQRLLTRIRSGERAAFDELFERHRKPGSADFGSTTVTSVGSSDAFVTRLDANGNFVWTRQFGGAMDDRGNGVAVDGAGNVLIIADTFGAPGGSGTRDVFICKIDPNGNSIWTSVVGASSSIPMKGKSTPTGYAGGVNIAVDAAGNVYSTGYMYGTVDFDPGSGTTALSGLAFVMKVAPDGNFAWARTFARNGSPTPDPRVWPADIAVDASGNVYSTGRYFGSVDFDPGTQKSQQLVFDAGRTNAAYVSALDSSGNLLWAKTTRCMLSATSVSVTPEAIALDGLGGVYLAGSFDTTIDFNPGADTFALTSAGALDAFVWKLDTSGNFVWAGQMGGTSLDFARGIAADGAGNIFVAGNFSGTADFDPGAGTYNLTSAGGYDFFVAKLVQTGALAATAAESQPSSADLSLAATPRRRLLSTSVDRVLAGLAEDSLTGRDPLDDELLLVLASAQSLPLEL